MRVLAKDESDDFLRAFEAVDVYFDSEQKALCFSLANSDSYYIENVMPMDADSIIYDLYSKGAADLTNLRYRLADV